MTAKFCALITSVFILGFSPSVYAKSLELRPILIDRFENDCGVREEYDFHDNEDQVMQPLSAHIMKTKNEEEQIYSSTIYTLKDVFYAGIPVIKMDFSFGNAAQQFNEFLYLDLRTPQSRAQFAKLDFKQRHQKKYTDIDVSVKKHIATVQCYWPATFNESVGR